MSAIGKYLRWSGILLFFLLLLCFAPACIEAGQKGLLLCAQRVIPSLFPFFVVSRLVISSGLTQPLGLLCRPLMRHMFHLRGELAAPLLLGLTGGYPIGASVIADLRQKGLCSQEEACRLLAFTSNTGPAFSVGMCGAALFGSVKIGCILYLIHGASAFLTGFLWNRAYPVPPKQPPLPPPVPINGEIVTAIRDSFAACLSITAFVTFFSVLMALFSQTGLLAFSAGLLALLPGVSAGDAAAFLWGLWEITGGLSALSPVSPLAAPLCSFLLAFGGLSVVFQTSHVLSGSGLPLRPYVLGKLIQGGLAFLFTFILFCLT